jgi:hypothetical protein
MSQVKVKYGDDVVTKNLQYLNSLKASVRNSQIKSQAQKVVKSNPPIAKVLPVKYGNDITQKNIKYMQSLGSKKQISKFKSQADKDIELGQTPLVNPRFTNISDFDESEMQSKQQQLAMELSKKIVKDDIQSVKLLSLISADNNGFRLFIKLSPKLIKYATEEIINPTAENVYKYYTKLSNQMQKLQNSDTRTYDDIQAERMTGIQNAMDLAQSNAESSSKIQADAMTEKERIRMANLKLLEDKNKTEESNMILTKLQQRRENQAMSKIGKLVLDKKARKQQQEEEARLQAEEEARLQAEEEARLQAEEEKRRRKEEKKRLKEAQKGQPEAVRKPKHSDEMEYYIDFNSNPNITLAELKNEFGKWNTAELMYFYDLMKTKYKVRSRGFANKSKEDKVNALYDLVRSQAEREDFITPAKSTPQKLKFKITATNLNKDYEEEQARETEQSQSEGTGFISAGQVYKHNVALLKGMKRR